jgi:hypothetical protein
MGDAGADPPRIEGKPRSMGEYERMAPIGPAGVLATACRRRGPDATREAPAVIAAAVNRELVRVRPGRLGWRRGPQYRGSRVMPGEGRGLSWKETQDGTKDEGIGDEPSNPE